MGAVAGERRVAIVFTDEVTPDVEGALVRLEGEGFTTFTLTSELFLIHGGVVWGARTGLPEEGFQVLVGPWRVVVRPRCDG